MLSRFYDSHIIISHLIHMWSTHMHPPCTIQLCYCSIKVYRMLRVYILCVHPHDTPSRALQLFIKKDSTYQAIRIVYHRYNLGIRCQAPLFLCVRPPLWLVIIFVHRAKGQTSKSLMKESLFTINTFYSVEVFWTSCKTKKNEYVLYAEISNNWCFTNPAWAHGGASAAWVAEDNEGGRPMCGVISLILVARNTPAGELKPSKSIFCVNPHLYMESKKLLLLVEREAWSWCYILRS